MTLYNIWEEWDWLEKEQLVTSIALSPNPLSQHWSECIKQHFLLSLHLTNATPCAFASIMHEKTIHYRPLVSLFSHSVLYCIKCDIKMFASGLSAGLRTAFNGPLLYKEASFKGSVFLQVRVITEKCFCSSRVNSQVSQEELVWKRVSANMPYNLLTKLCSTCRQMSTVHTRREILMLHAHLYRPWHLPHTKMVMWQACLKWNLHI